MFTRLQNRHRCIQEKTSVSPLKWTQTKILACDVLFLSLSGFLSASVSLHSCECNIILQLSPLHGQNLNLAANQNSIFENIIHVGDALHIFHLDILLHIITSESLFRFTLYILLVHSIICDEIQKQIMCVSAICTNDKFWKRKRWIFSDLFKWGRRRCRLVNWRNKMILRDDCLVSVQFKCIYPSLDKLKPPHDELFETSVWNRFTKLPVSSQIHLDFFSMKS